MDYTNNEAGELEVSNQPRLKYIMLLKLLIILSSNSFFILTHYSQYKASYYITKLYSYFKNDNIVYLLRKSKKDLWFFQLAKGIFSELCCYGYELYCIVGFSLCE